MQEREKKLPVWAQVLIQELRCYIEALEEQVKYSNKDVEPSSIYWEKWDTGLRGRKAVRHYVPDRLGRLFVDLGKNRHGQEERMEINIDTGTDGTTGVLLRCAYGTLRIMPVVGNTIYVTPHDPRD